MFLFLCSLFPSTPVIAFPQAAAAEQHAREGFQLAQSGKLKEAELELRRAVAVEPNDAGYLAGLGGILGMEGNLKAANGFFAKAARLDPNNRIIRRDLAANEWQLDELNSAKTNLERILHEDPGDQASILLLGMVETGLKNYARAAQFLGSVPDLVKQHPQALAALARSDYHTGQTARAKETLGILVSHFSDPRSVFLAGEMAEEARDSETAKKLFDAIRTTYPDPTRLAYHLAHTDYLSGDWAACQHILLQLVGNGYRTGESFDLLGRCDAKQDKIVEAQKAFASAITLSPSSESAYLDLAALFVRRERRDTAIEVTGSCVKALPESFECYEEKGTIEESQHYHKQAVASFGHAAQLNPSSGDAEFGLAQSLAGLGRGREAGADYERAIRLDPHRADFYREYARLLLADSGRNNTAARQRATSLLDKAVMLDAFDAESRLLLGECFLNAGEIDRAVPLLRAAERLDPQNGRPHYLLWRAYGKLGRNREAASELAAFERLSVKPHEPTSVPK